MRVCFYIFLLAFSAMSDAVVQRHDIPAENYALQKAPEFLIDMPHEGHGVLIAPQWVVTVAHTIFYDYVGKRLKVGKNTFEIEAVHIHPDYIEANDTLFKGDAAPLMEFLATRSDIALIKLSTPVSLVAPINIYADNKEEGMLITVYGRGATGNGKSGENVKTKSYRKLNHFNNIIESAKEHWLSYKFNEPNAALPLEGIHGSGDSGGPSIVIEKGSPYLVGLSSWQVWHGDLANFKGGLYGTTAYQVRVSSYYKWILSIINN